VGDELRPAAQSDHDELFAAYAQIVDAGDGFPHAPPLSRHEFDDYWIAHTSAVWVLRAEYELIGAYYIKPNFVGLGRRMVEHSLREAQRLGFDAMQFNLVFASNPARHLYLRLGFVEVGRVPAAVDGDDALIYWRSLEEGT